MNRETIFEEVNMSNYYIIWSPKAKITYYHILEYIEENWTKKELRTFVNRTKQVLKHISQNPALYPYSAQSDTLDV